MSRNDNSFTSKVTLLSRFRVLDGEGQKEILKKLIIDGYFGGYVENRTEAYKNNEFVSPTPEEVEEYKKEIEKEVETAFNSIIDTINSNDEELKYKIFQNFVENYNEVEKTAKKEICGYKHDYSDWKLKQGERPFFDETGEIDDVAEGEYFERKCFYCGTTEVAYSEEQKKQIEEADKNMAEYFEKTHAYALQFKKQKNSL